MVTYVNNLGLSEIATGDSAGNWGVLTNTSLELIGEALGYATEQSFGSDANTTSAVDNGATSPVRSIYFKVTSAGSLTATRQLTITPDTIKRLMFIENATTGGESITIKQGTGSGAAVTIPNGHTKAVTLNGGGTGAIVADAFAALNVGANFYVKNPATTDGSTANIYLQTAEEDIAVNDVLGKINFQAPDETSHSAGDNKLVAAAIQAISEGDFSQTNNATSLAFMTAASEAATTKMTLSSLGNLTLTSTTASTSSTTGSLIVGGGVGIADDLYVGDDLAVTGLATIGETLAVTGIATFTDDIIIGNGKTIGSAGDVDAMSISSGGVVNFSARPTFAASLTIENGGSLGSAGDLNAITISSGGVVAVTATTASSSSTTGSLTVGGGAGIADDLYVGDDLAVTGLATIGETLAVTGVVTANAGVVVDTMTLDAATLTATGALTFDVVGNINLDSADGGGVTLLDTGTAYGLAFSASNSLTLKSTISDGDMIFQGNDGGSAITALTLSMANDGAATFKNSITYSGDLISSTSGASNFRAGANAGDAIVSGGTKNVLIGDEAGTGVTTGDQNTFVGYAAGDVTTTSSNNTGIGNNALGGNILGSNSVAIGKDALEEQNPAGSSIVSMNNTAVGTSAGQKITTGTNNTFVGHTCGDLTNDGVDNTAVGQGALSANCGNNNTAVGKNALGICENQHNTAVGKDAGGGVVGGTENVFIGVLAGNHGVAHASGSGNICLGSYSDTTAVNSSLAIAIGYDVSGEAGYTTIGTSGTTSRLEHGTEDWATVSDERIKKNVTDATAGLSFINDLTPRTFKYKNRGELPETFEAYEADSTEVFKNSYTNHGFIAQEVKTVIDAHSEIKDGFSMWGERPDGCQEVAKSALIPILVKAIQEQNALIEALTARVAVLEG